MADDLTSHSSRPSHEDASVGGFGLGQQTDVRRARVEHDLGTARLTPKDGLQLPFDRPSRLAGHRPFGGGIDAMPLWKEHADAEQLRAWTGPGEDFPYP